MPENNSDTTSDDKNSSTLKEVSSSSSSINYSSCSDDCRHLAHIESIPIRHGGRLRLIRRARVAFTKDTWHVINWNCGGPGIDICYRVPGNKNTWIARISTDNNHGRMMSELLSLIESHCTNKQKLYGQKYYVNYEEEDGEDAMSVIIESLEGTGEGPITELMEGPERIPSLQAKLGFGVMKY